MLLPFIGIPQRPCFFYGWVMVAVALVVNIVASPLNPIIFSFFIGPMSEDMGWSRSALSWSLTIRLVAAGVTGPFIGLLVDRFGSRWLGVLAAIIAGGAVMALGAANDLWVIYILFAVSGAVGLGGGAGGNLLTLVPVAKWFTLFRGRAMAIAGTGLAVGTVIAVPVAGWLIDSFDWQTGWVVFGVALTVVGVPVFAIFARRAPEDMGLKPDGLTDTPVELGAAPTTSPVTSEVDWTVKQAVRTPAFWMALGAFSLIGLALSGTLVHRVGFWKDVGLSSGIVTFGTAMDPFTVIFSMLFFGIVGERLAPRYLGLIGGIGLALSMLPLVFASNHAYLVFLHNIVWGAAAGSYVTANNLIWPNYFGRKFLGTIRGFVLPLTIVVTGLSVPLYGYLLDAGINPKALWTLSLVLFAAAGVMLFFTRPPVFRPEPTAQAEQAGATQT